MDMERMMMTAMMVQAAFNTTDGLPVLIASIGCALDFWAADVKYQCRGRYNCNNTSGHRGNNVFYGQYNRRF